MGQRPKMAKPREGKRSVGTPEEKLAQAVRNSLNLPRLQVRVRRNESRRSWSFLLKEGRACSDWLELDSDSVAVMKKVGLLPAIHLGIFRLAYAALQSKESEDRSQKSE